MHLSSLFPPKHFPHVQMCHYIESIWNTLRCQIITARFLLGSVVEYPCADFCGPCFFLFGPCDFYTDHVFHFNPLPCGFYSDWVFSKSCIRSYCNKCVGHHTPLVIFGPYFLVVPREAFKRSEVSNPCSFYSGCGFTKITYEVFIPPMCTIWHHISHRSRRNFIQHSTYWGRVIVKRF